MIDMHGNDAPWLFLTLLSVILFAWPTWLALIGAQVVMLFYGMHEARWLPAGLMAVGFAFMVLRVMVWK